MGRDRCTSNVHFAALFFLATLTILFLTRKVPIDVKIAKTAEIDPSYFRLN